jgi:hypothetical protein
MKYFTYTRCSTQNLKYDHSFQSQRWRSMQPHRQWRPLASYTLVTLPRNVTPYRDNVDGTRDRVTYQKLVTRSRYWLVRCAVGIWPSHQRLRSEQVWKGNVPCNNRPLLCPFHSWCSCLEEWCESVVLCGFLSVSVIVKWSELRKVSQN